MDVLLVDCFFNDFPGAEGDVSGGVEVSGFLLEGAESGSGGFDLSELNIMERVTLAFFSLSTTLTILPKEGMTLILMLLKISGEITRLGRLCFGMT